MSFARALFHGMLLFSTRGYFFTSRYYFCAMLFFHVTLYISRDVMENCDSMILVIFHILSPKNKTATNIFVPLRIFLIKSTKSSMGNWYN